MLLGGYRGAVFRIVIFYKYVLTISTALPVLHTSISSWWNTQNDEKSTISLVVHCCLHCANQLPPLYLPRQCPTATLLIQSIDSSSR